MWQMVVSLVGMLNWTLGNKGVYSSYTWRAGYLETGLYSLFSGYTFLCFNDHEAVTD
jgi:hypothetical protein